MFRSPGASLRDASITPRSSIASLRDARDASKIAPRCIATRCFDRCAIFDRTFSKVRKVTVILTVFAPHALARERRHGASYKFLSLFALARFKSPRSLEQIAWFSNFLHSFEKKKEIYVVSAFVRYRERTGPVNREGPAEEAGLAG